MSSAILKEIEEIIEEKPIDKLIVKALINELRRRLLEYIMIDNAMRKKYRMSFEEFKAKVAKEENYSFEVENDYCDWELAIDGIKTIKEKIEKLEKLL